MRKIGFLLILTGIGLAYLYPLFQEQFTGSEFARERIFDRANGGWKTRWEPVELEIAESQSPVRIRFVGEISSGVYFQNNDLPITVDLQGPDGKVLSSALKINNRENRDAQRGTEKTIQISTTDFGIIASGKHTLRTTAQVERDVNLIWMDAVFLANVAQRDTQFRDIGIGMFAAGALLVIVGRRKRRKSRDKASKPARWGRRK